MFRFLRCTWVLTVSHQTEAFPKLQVPGTDVHGWLVIDNGFVQVVWETGRVVQETQQLPASVLSGCRCRSDCQSRRCECVEAGSQG